LSMRNDLTAAAICAEDDDGVVHGACFAFSPLGGIAERSQRDRVPYDAWARDGVIYAPPGDTLNYDMIADWLRIKLQEEEIPINSLGFDRWRITDMQQAAERVGFAQDCEWVEVGQGFQSMSPIVEHFESLLLERRLKLGNNPILNLGASSAIAVSDPSGGRKLSKTKASNKIDGIVALIMAVHRTAQNNEMFDAAAMIG